MQLVTYAHEGAHRLGLVDGDAVIDLNAAYASYLLREEAVHYDAETIAWAILPPAMTPFLRREAGGWQALARAVDHLREVEARCGETPLAPSGRPTRRALSQVSLQAPVPEPGKLICVGQNYLDHCREQGVEPPDHPVIFAKFNNAIIGPGDAIRLPEASQQVDYEAELAFVMGRRARKVTAEDALECVAGYTILNDVSARDMQFADGQWVRGKSPDTFAPLGPALVTPDQLGDPHVLDISLKVNGEILQDSNTENLIFRVPELIAFISQVITLEPGDVVTTGTPPGVGVFREPPVFLTPGDTVEVAIQGLGVLENPVAAAE